jgi:hypothetical protein
MQDPADNVDEEAPSQFKFSRAALEQMFVSEYIFHVFLSLITPSFRIGKNAVSAGAKSRLVASVRIFLRNLIRSAAYASVERAKNTHGSYDGQADASKMSIENDWSHILPSPKSARVDITEQDVRVAISQRQRTTEFEEPNEKTLKVQENEPSSSDAEQADRPHNSGNELPKRQTRSSAQIDAATAPDLPQTADRAKRKKSEPSSPQHPPDTDEPSRKRRKI